MTQFGYKPGLFGALRGNANGSQGRLSAARAIDVYNRSKSPPGVPPLPVTSGTSDVFAFIRAMATGQEDISASISITPIPFLYANITGQKLEVPDDVFGNIFPSRSASSNLYTSIKAINSASTEQLTYTSILVGSAGGASIINRLTTTLPDLNASLSGWDYVDLGATLYVYQRATTDLEAIVGSVAQTASNLLATIIATYTDDFPASITTVPFSSLTGSVVSIPPSDLLATLVPVPPKDLFATGGGHLPEDITGVLQTIQPVDLTALIRAGNSATSDLTASVTASGGYSDISCRIRSLVSGTYDLNSSITAKTSYDIGARILAWDSSDVAAYIYGNHASSMSAYIKGVGTEATSDLVTFIRPAFGGTSDLTVTLHGWISARTSDKLYNYDLLPRPARTIFLAHSVGLTMMTIEPIRGYFPDLHATITGVPFSVYDLKAYIRPLVSDSADLSAAANAVTGVINITKVPIEFSNVGDLSATITAYSGYNDLTAVILGSVSASTSTSPGAGWVYISSSINFYLGTNKGLFVPSRVVRSVRPERFVNSSPTPDLWAYARGWAQSDMAASISVYPNLPLTASITGQDLSHIKALSATITSVYTSDLTSSVTSTGYYTEMPASISATGSTSTLSASIRPYLKVLGFRFIPVETMPFLELKAVLNPISSCSVSSGYLNINAFVRGTTPAVGGSDLTASIVSLRDRLDLSASIIGRKITKIRTIDVWFRSQTRAGLALTALCVGVGNGTSDISTYIKGIPHTDDLGATITAFRHRFNKITTVEDVKVYKDYFTSVELYKTIGIHFSSQVEKYVYDSLNSAIYEIDGEKWVLDLSEITDTGEFFDRYTGDRNHSIDSLVEYDSIDEAIRAGIAILTEWRTSDLSASITATGGYLGLTATVAALRPDKYSDLHSKIMPVTAIPDLYASITAYSGYSALAGFITGQSHGPEQLDADIIGVVYESLSANITGVT